MNQTLGLIIRGSSDILGITGTVANLRQSLIGLLWFEIAAAFLTYGIGFIGNILAFIVFCSLEEFQKVSTGFLFLLMAISNFFHLWTLATESIATYGYHLYPNVFFQCRLSPFVKNLSRAMSTYSSVGIAIDRFIRSEMPLRSKQICTRKNVSKLATILLIIFCLFWSFYLLPYSSQDISTATCYYNQSAIYYFFLAKINIPLRAILFCLLPVIIMTVSNIRMFNNIRQSHHRIANVQAIHVIMKNDDGILVFNIHGPGFHRTSATDRMLFFMMIANVAVFMVTQIPFYLYAVIRIYFQVLNGPSHLLIYGMLLLWSSIYFGIAFFFYCFASPLFRKKSIEIAKTILHRNST